MNIEAIAKGLAAMIEVASEEIVIDDNGVAKNAYYHIDDEGVDSVTSVKVESGMIVVTLDSGRVFELTVGERV